MKNLLILLVLIPALVLGGTPPHNTEVTVNSNNTRTVDRSIGVETGDVSTNSTVDFQATASSAYAYAAQCGTGGGMSTRNFGISQSGESQYCKHLRISAFYEGLYTESKSRADNIMAQVWYNAMVRELTTAQSLIDSTSFTGSMKETASDLLMPTLLCGGLAAVTAGGYGVICAGGLILKAQSDQEIAENREDTVVGGLEDRDTNFVEKDTPVCTYVDGQLSQSGSCLAN